MHIRCVYVCITRTYIHTGKQLATNIIDFKRVKKNNNTHKQTHRIFTEREQTIETNNGNEMHKLYTGS